MIEPTRELRSLSDLLQRYRVVGLIGAPQAVKTTLARDLALKVKGLPLFVSWKIHEGIAPIE